MHILLTGGLGFIGTNFVRHVLQHRADVRVTNLDLVTYAGNPENLRDLESHPRYRFLRGDVADPDAVASAFADHVDVVVNMAAESHVDRSIEGPAVFVRTNVLGTQVLLDAARRAAVSRFVQVSTDEVYGSLGSTGAFHEDSPIDPSSPYSATKAAADLLVQAYGRTFGLPWNITRCSNNYGPHQDPEKLIPLMVSRARSGDVLPVYGDGLNVRDWIHVQDHCEAILAVVERAPFGRVYNVGAENEWPNIEIVRTILRLLGKPESLVRHVTDRPGHDRRYAIDASRLRDELGWAPKMGFERGLAETIEWYGSHEAWWRTILASRGGGQ
jgi:dTDP-glucose 4,6-dehydratase